MSEYRDQDIEYVYSRVSDAIDDLFNAGASSDEIKRVITEVMKKVSKRFGGEDDTSK